MLKYSEMIARLTDEQKIRILSGVGNISGKDMKNLGIPFVKFANMKDYNRKIYPHTTSLSHSWNTSLWSRVASAKIKTMTEDNVKFAFAPGAKIKLSPYRKETTEDPYLASMISGAYLKAATDANMQVGASGYYVTEADTEWMDKQPCDRILREYLVRPYERASKIASSKNLITDIRLSDTPYSGVSEHVQRIVKDKTEFFICEHATDSNTVHLISQGIICLSASANALSSALTRYRALAKPLEDGKNDVLPQIEEEIKNGTAISDDSIDAAVDRALDLLFLCKSSECRPVSGENESELALKATLESTVLLKNQNQLLPLSAKKKIAIVDAFSPITADEQPISLKCAKKLEDRGYTRLRATHVAYQQEKLFTSVRHSDVTVLLLGAGHDAESMIHKTEKLSLPPDQLALADRLSKTAKRLVAVIFSEHAPDIDFTRSFDSVILAPLPVRYSAEALTEILSGEYSPTGRLAYTLYSGTDTSLKKGAAYLRDHGMKAGPFIGYRYYDTADLRVGYPFGHGLSYTEFSYSDISVNGNTVSFTVQNCGKFKGSEVAQVYIGIHNSALVRPKKELCGFAKIELLPLEKKRLTLEIDIPEIFYNGVFGIERGTYTVYVGSSVSDIRLTGTLTAGDMQPKKESVQLSDYLQSHSNILNDNYTLEADYGIMKKGIKNIVAGIVSLALAITLAVFNTTTYTASLLLGVISGILAVSSILFFIMEVVEKNRIYAEERKRIAEANQKHFEDANEIPVLSTDTMFKTQFDLVDIETFENTELSDDNDNFDASAYIDDQFRIRDAVEEFYSFASQRGYKMSVGVVESLISSIAVSRLLIFTGLSSEEFNSFSLLLSEYFGCSLCMDNSPKSIEEQGNNIYFGYDSEGYGTKKNILKALGNAVNQPTRIHLSAINDISSANINDWLSPMLRYVSSIKKKNEITVPDASGKKLRFVLGNNLWIMLRLADGQSIESLPISLIKYASVIPVSYTKTQVSDDQDESQGFTSYQVDFMLESENGKHEITEEIWKKVDKIEKYAKQHSGYSIGNKLWLELEKQMSMLLACEMDPTDAIDAALAVRVLPSISIALKGVLEKDDPTVLQTAEAVLGADHIQYSKAYTDSLVFKEKIKEADNTENDLHSSEKTESVSLTTKDYDEIDEDEEISFSSDDEEESFSPDDKKSVNSDDEEEAFSSDDKKTVSFDAEDNTFSSDEDEEKDSSTEE